MQISLRPILFDLDGTLIHSIPDLTIALNILFERHNHPKVTDNDVATWVGDGAKALVMRALQTHTPPQTLDTLTAEFIEIYSRAPAAHTRPYQGVMETLALLQAKGHPLAVVTNKPEQPTHLILRQLGLDHFFDVVIGGDTTAERKPSTLPLQTALAALQKHHDIAPNAAIMVGDSRNDIIPAKELGLIAISVAFGYGHLCAADQALSDYHITNFANICPIIDNL